MTPLIAAGIALGAAGLGWFVFARPDRSRSSALPSAFAEPQAPLLGPPVTGIQPGWSLLVRTVQPNGSGADLTVQVDQVTGDGFYMVHGLPAVDGYDPAWGVVYPTRVGDADVIWKEDAQGNRVSGLSSILFPRARVSGVGAESDVRARHRARQQRGIRT